MLKTTEFEETYQELNSTEPPRTNKDFNRILAECKARSEGKKNEAATPAIYKQGKTSKGHAWEGEATPNTDATPVPDDLRGDAFSEGFSFWQPNLGSCFGEFLLGKSGPKVRNKGLQSKCCSGKLNLTEKANQRLLERSPFHTEG